MSGRANGAIEKVIVFRFHGGAQDGQVIRSDDPQSSRQTRSFWLMTWSGTIGRRFDVASEQGPAFERYQVKSRYELEDEVHVTCEYVN
jgi:hypothetical protein